MAFEFAANRRGRLGMLLGAGSGRDGRAKNTKQHGGNNGHNNRCSSVKTTMSPARFSLGC